MKCFNFNSFSTLNMISSNLLINQRPKENIYNVKKTETNLVIIWNSIPVNISIIEITDESDSDVYSEVSSLIMELCSRKDAV